VTTRTIEYKNKVRRQGYFAC